MNAAKSVVEMEIKLLSPEVIPEQFNSKTGGNLFHFIDLLH